MTAIQQSSISSRHSIDDTGQHSGSNNGGGAEHGRETMDNSAGVYNSSTVNISFQATMRLQAYQEQRALLTTKHEMVVTANPSSWAERSPDRTSTQ